MIRRRSHGFDRSPGDDVDRSIRWREFEGSDPDPAVGLRGTTACMPPARGFVRTLRAVNVTLPRTARFGFHSCMLPDLIRRLRNRTCVLRGGTS